MRCPRLEDNRAAYDQWLRQEMWDRMSYTSSSDLPFLGASFLNSSASPSTRFMCLSKAINLQQRACDVK